MRRPPGEAQTGAARRAERLLRWYPASWRARYGDEFADLLTSEMSETERSWRRTANVVRSGIEARLTRAGLTRHRLEPSQQAVASLASLGCAVALFLAFGAAMLAQLTIGWQWAPPDTAATTTAMVVMSGVMVLFSLLVVLAALPVAGALVLHIIRRRAGGLVRPTLLFVGGAVLLVMGSRHFGNGWPGTGGHHWAHQGLVPGGVAAFLWASTLSISSYWAHPGALFSFPAAEVAWMVVSPVAVVTMAVAATELVRRLDLSPRLLRFEGWLGRVAGMAMATFLVGACLWLVDGGPGPRNLFHAGVIDGVGLAMMALALLVSHRAAVNAHRAVASLAAT